MCQHPGTSSIRHWIIQISILACWGLLDDRSMWPGRRPSKLNRSSRLLQPGEYLWNSFGYYSKKDDAHAFTLLILRLICAFTAGVSEVVTTNVESVCCHESSVVRTRVSEEQAFCITAATGSSHISGGCIGAGGQETEFSSQALW